MEADVVMLQELSPKGGVMISRALKFDFPYHHFSEGVAILSRFPLKNARYRHSEHGINGFLFVEVESPGGRLQVASLHLDPLRIWTAREKWSLPAQLIWGQGEIHRGEIREILDALRTDLPTILAGDFNSANGAAIRELKMLGFTDSYAAVTDCPNRTPTLHFSLLGFKAGRRIDYIFHDKSFQTVESQVFSGLPSDHDTVVSVLRWNQNQ